MPKMNVKKGDQVVVLSGKDKGKQGEVLTAKPAEGKVVVEGVAVVKKATRPNPANQQGGIVNKEAPIQISNVMLLHKGEPTRVGFRVEEDGKKVRFAKKSGEKID